MAEYIVDTTEGVLNARTTGELVRCRDCWYYLRGRCDWLLMLTGRMLPAIPFEPAPDGYCAWGEKRDGER